jgi:hypothetical protein
MLGLNLNRTVSDLRAVEFSLLSQILAKKIIVSSGEMSLLIVEIVFFQRQKTVSFICYLVT